MNTINVLVPYHQNYEFYTYKYYLLQNTEKI